MNFLQKEKSKQNVHIRGFFFLSVREGVTLARWVLFTTWTVYVRITADIFGREVEIAFTSTCPGIHGTTRKRAAGGP